MENVKTGAVVNEMVWKEVLQKHDSDVGFASTRLKIDDAAIAKGVIGPSLPDPVVDSPLVLSRI